MPEALRAGFAHVTDWVFDLDNTLYPAHLSLWQQIDERIKGFIADALGLPPDEAFRLQKDYYRRYGTSLRGLVIEHGIDPAAFLHHVHDIDHAPLEADDRLSAAILALPGRKFVFTSGTHAHVQAVTRKLGLEGHFDGVFDIVDAGLVPKPFRETYEKFVGDHGIDPARAAMFEDLPRNLEAPHQMGMRTVLVVPRAGEQVIRETWEHEGREATHIEHMTDDLAGFLRRISGLDP